MKSVFSLILSAMFLALAVVLPLLTGQIPQVGKMLCPMHIPVLLCGFFCGPWYGLVAGFLAPYLRLLLFGIPVLMPTGVAMSFELATYGFVAGLLYERLPKRPAYLYAALLGAMVAGRIVWGLVSILVYRLNGSSFGWAIFMSGAFLKSLPGIALQLILIPVIVMTIRRRDRLLPD